MARRSSSSLATLSNRSEITPLESMTNTHGSPPSVSGVGAIHSAAAGLSRLASKSCQTSRWTNSMSSPNSSANSSMSSFADLGGGHLREGDPTPNYNSSPATSGPHAPSSTACGIYAEEIPDVVQVHNLEHGTVVVQYLPDLDGAGLSRIQEFAREKDTHILVAPREDLTHPVVVTGWTKMLRLETADFDVIGAFYDRFARRGPEVGVPCLFQIDQSLG